MLWNSGITTWNRSDTSQQHLLKSAVPKCEALTYAFAMDSEAGAVDLSINGMRVSEGPLWTGVSDLTEWTPLVCLSRRGDPNGAELVAVSDCE
jgi:hypothetical protein